MNEEAGNNQPGSKCASRCNFPGYAIMIAVVIGILLFCAYYAGLSDDLCSQSSPLDKMLGCEINAKIEKYTKFAVIDYSLSQIIFWIAIVASMAAAIIIATGVLKNNILLVAVIAAIPAVTVTISEKLNFEARSRWDTEYLNGLHKLRRELLVMPNPPNCVDNKLTEIQKELANLEEKMENQYPYSSNITRSPTPQDSRPDSADQVPAKPGKKQDEKPVSKPNSTKGHLQ